MTPARAAREGGAGLSLVDLLDGAERSQMAEVLELVHAVHELPVRSLQGDRRRPRPTVAVLSHFLQKAAIIVA